MNAINNSMLSIFLCSLMSCYQVFGVNTWIVDSIQANFTTMQCDSLVQANTTNPDFVIMDVRTPAEYLPSHLNGAINRNYYDTDFAIQIAQLPHHKIYMIHCAAGSRSAQVYNLMLSLGFPSVINMLGGINGWNAAGFPVTSTLAPLLMPVSDTMVASDSVFVGMTDSIPLTITNRANDTLWVTGITPLAGTEFSTNFDTSLALTGPFDFSFYLYYTPTDTLSDSLTFRIESNGGTLQFHVPRTGKMLPTGTTENSILQYQQKFRNYPNPFSSETTLEFSLEENANVSISILDPSARVIKNVRLSGQKGINMLSVDTHDLSAGTYLCKIENGRQCQRIKMIKR